MELWVEPFTHSFAQMRLLSRIGPTVPDEDEAVAEGLPTVTALVGLLARVDPLVVNEGRVGTEVLPALAALVGLLPVWIL